MQGEKSYIIGKSKIWSLYTKYCKTHPACSRSHFMITQPSICLSVVLFLSNLVGLCYMQILRKFFIKHSIICEHANCASVELRNIFECVGHSLLPNIYILCFLNYYCWWYSQLAVYRLDLAFLATYQVIPKDLGHTNGVI